MRWHVGVDEHNRYCHMTLSVLSQCYVMSSEVQSSLHSVEYQQAGASIPLTPWSKFPLPFPPPFPLSSLPLPLEVGPLIVARGSGERFSSPVGPGWARSPNGIW